MNWSFADTLTSTLRYVEHCKRQGVYSDEVRLFLTGLWEWWAMEQLEDKALDVIQYDPYREDIR